MCELGAVCTNGVGATFGMVGDSWTDLFLSFDYVRTLRQQLEQDYGYHIIGSTIGGTTMEGAYARGAHIQVIETAGPDIKYMLLSLGGNDLQFTPSGYLGDVVGERNRRLAKLEQILHDMILSGNAYKQSRYGGDGLLWIIHGYDYPNPDKPFGASDPASCRPTLKKAGFSDAEIDVFPADLVNSYNEFLTQQMLKEPFLRYINLRGTLGGPPTSDPSLMTDCIHPNEYGFQLITARYEATLRGWTNDDK